MNLYRWVSGLGLVPRVIGNVKGSSGSVPQPGHAEGVRREVGPEPGDGDVVRRRLQDQFRAGDRRERDWIQGACRGACRAVSSLRRIVRSSSRRSTTSTNCGSLGASSTTRSGRRWREGLLPRGAPGPEAAALSELYKMGDGPLYPFWIPYHLPHFEAPDAIARVAVFGDSTGPAARRVRSSKCAPWPSAISRLARPSTSTACS